MDVSELRPILLAINSRLDEISERLSELREGLEETQEIASVFKEFGQLMGSGQMPSSVPMLGPTS